MLRFLALTLIFSAFLNFSFAQTEKNRSYYNTIVSDTFIKTIQKHARQWVSQANSEIQNPSPEIKTLMSSISHTYPGFLDLSRELKQLGIISQNTPYIDIRGKLNNKNNEAIVGGLLCMIVHGAWKLQKETYDQYFLLIHFDVISDREVYIQSIRLISALKSVKLSEKFETALSEYASTWIESGVDEAQQLFNSNNLLKNYENDLNKLHNFSKKEDISSLKTLLMPLSFKIDKKKCAYRFVIDGLNQRNLTAKLQNRNLYVFCFSKNTQNKLTLEKTYKQLSFEMSHDHERYIQGFSIWPPGA